MVYWQFAFAGEGWGVAAARHRHRLAEAPHGSFVCGGRFFEATFRNATQEKINRCFERIKLMDDSEQRPRLCPNDDLGADRSIVRQSIEEILSEIEHATRDAGLYYAIGLTVPYSGDAVATVLTTDDPPDADWSHVTGIVCDILSRKLGDMRLRSRPLPCAITSTRADAADLVQE